MERRTPRSARTPGGWRAGRPGPDGATGDRHWRLDARSAGFCALGFAGLTLLLDWGSGGLTVPRADLWAVLGVLLFTVLRPPRVSAGDGWLAVRGLVRERRVCTDALVAVRQNGSIAIRLVLRDAYGGSVAFDPGILVANPLLWHRLDAGARRSRERGTLRQGESTLRLLGERIDGGTARDVLRASGLE
ncbi:hypothetical protein [Streptomyces milbemycinicus]|uniref:Integral membrane protein n=1 Tax=Streptomyces milbemycinicus TaxID=476552 RepID=A0ABW8LNX3_9ACTN